MRRRHRRDATDLRIATFVSVAKMPGEEASATLVQTIGQYPKLGERRDQPAADHYASGSAGVTGTLQVVTNPNAGGPGVPVSVWTRVNVDKTGTTNTCYADEFFRYTQGQRNPDAVPGHDPLRRLPVRCQRCAADIELTTAAASTVRAPAMRRHRHTRRRCGHEFDHRLPRPAATRASTTTSSRIRCRTRCANSRRTCSSTCSAYRRGTTTTTTVSARPSAPRCSTRTRTTPRRRRGGRSGRGLSLQERRQGHRQARQCPDC